MRTVAVLFGGRSTEHGISCLTAGGVMGAIDRTKWNVLAVGIDDDGAWTMQSDDPADWVHEYGIEAPYEYVDEAGWQTAGVLWGYWDDLEGTPFDADDFVRVDHVVVSDAWITPPF